MTTTTTTTTTKYRDRTAEFYSITQTLKKIGGITPFHQTQSHQAHNSSPSKPLLSSITRSEFNKKASLIGSGVHETSHKISRLAQLAKRSSMFNDPTVEIQELTVLIKNDITALNAALTDLQTIQNMEIADGNYSEDRLVDSIYGGKRNTEKKTEQRNKKKNKERTERRRTEQKKNKKEKE
ncbi:SYNTAXIN-31 [Salix koriyanagi]|uniref:SYNTAXIN-31 n=1 Tax=Salix koriyanagi TaxID=2511006 RepID=A0A9Q0X1X2_9ROSI|nr:SYNTAXIN-31 [Salix koriyanagi]